MYSRILKHIPIAYRESATIILRWVTLAIYPLTLHQLQVVADIKGSDLVSAERAIRHRVALCGPLLRIQDDLVSLVHQSARDYLLIEEHDSDAVLEKLRIKPKQDHFKLAQTCLGYVTAGSSQENSYHDPLQDLNDLIRRLTSSRKFPFGEYSILYWPHHMAMSGSLASKAFDRSNLFFNDKSTLREQWWKDYCYLQY